MSVTSTIAKVKRLQQIQADRILRQATQAQAIEAGEAMVVEAIPVAPTKDIWTDFNPYPGGQTAFWDVVPMRSVEAIPYTFVWAKGGLNSGKSYMGAGFAVTRALLDPEARGLITANTFGQLTTSTLPVLIEFCDEFGIDLWPRRDSTEETAKAIANSRLCKIGGASVLILSADAFEGTTESAKESGRGLKVRWIWADEFAYADASAFRTLLGRLGRGPGTMEGIGVITSSINKNRPFNWAYDYFDDPERTPELRALYRSVNLKTADNQSLSSKFIGNLEATYTANLAAIELRGEYAVDNSSLLFNYFDRVQHSLGRDLDPGMAMHVGFDFNRSPATALLCRVDIPNSPDAVPTITVCEEFYLLESDTFRLADAVADRIKAINPPRIYIYGDASGRSKTANSKKTNWQIIRDALNDRGLTHIMKVPNANPAIADSVNSVNVAFKNDRLYIHPRCKETIRDLEYLQDDGFGGIEKKKDPMRSHLGDILRYVVHSIAPFRRAGGIDWILASAQAE